MPPDSRRGTVTHRNDGGAMPPEIPFRGYPNSRIIMYLCITICTCICIAWQWSMGPMQTEVSLWGSRESRSLEQRQILQILHTHFTLKMADIQGPGLWWKLITPAFSHMHIDHLVGNLVAFTEFSNMLLAAGIQPAHYALLILGSAASAHLAFLYNASCQRCQTPWWRVLLVPVLPRVELEALGLSGVIMGLGAALALAAPNTRVRVLGVSRGRASVPAWVLMVAYIVFDAARLDDVSSETAHAAHLGGAAFGVVFYFSELRGRTALPFAWRL